MYLMHPRVHSAKEKEDMSNRDLGSGDWGDAAMRLGQTYLLMTCGGAERNKCRLFACSRRM